MSKTHQKATRFTPLWIAAPRLCVPLRTLRLNKTLIKISNARVTFADINMHGEVSYKNGTRKTNAECGIISRPLRSELRVRITYNGKETVHGLGLDWLDYKTGRRNSNPKKNSLMKRILMVLFIYYANCCTSFSQEIQLPFGLTQKQIVEADTSGFNQLTTDSLGQLIKNGKWYYSNYYPISFNLCEYYIGRYENGRKEGLWYGVIQDYIQERFYITSIHQYHQDTLSGAFIYLHPNGKVEISANFDRGQVHGLVCRYDKKENLVEMSVYEHDKLYQNLYTKQIKKTERGSIKITDAFPLPLTIKDGKSYWGPILEEQNEPFLKKSE